MRLTLDYPTIYMLMAVGGVLGIVVGLGLASGKHYLSALLVRVTNYFKH